MCEELTTVFLGDEEEAYIQKFCQVYKDEITTPDGLVVFCKYPERTARHFCCGKRGPFQIARAQRILWAKYILLNPSKRIVLEDTQTSNILFFLSRSRKPYVVVCNRLEGKLNLVSGAMVRGERAVKYRNGDPPYKFYNFG